MSKSPKPSRKSNRKPKPVVCDGFDGQFTKMYGPVFVWSKRKNVSD